MFEASARLLYVSREISFLLGAVKPDSEEELNLIAFLMFCRIKQEHKQEFRKALTHYFELESKIKSPISGPALALLQTPQQKIAAKIVELIDRGFEASEEEKVIVICQDLCKIIETTPNATNLTAQQKFEIREKISGLMPPLVQAIKGTLEIHLKESQELKTHEERLAELSKENIVKEIATLCLASRSPTMQETKNCLVLFEGCEEIMGVLAEIDRLQSVAEQPDTSPVGCSPGAIKMLKLFL